MDTIRHTVYLILCLILLSVAGCEKEGATGRFKPDIAPADIESHIRYLAGDDLGGRETGTPGEARASNYIADHFERYGLIPLGDEGTYFQHFTVNMSALNNPHRPDSAGFPDEERLSRNVVGMVEGTEYPDNYIVVGAHYDHLGMGAFGSLYDGAEPKVHNGADDNASGTAGVLELAHYYAAHEPANSIIFIAFSGEEIGLLGSRHFVEHPPVRLERVEAMINMDMIGRLNEGRLMVFGVGSSDRWPSLVKTANVDSLAIKTIPDGTGSSDHTSFYNKQIPVLHYFTDTHADYHRPSDDADFINFGGEEKVLEHIRRIVDRIDEPGEGPLAFTEAPVTRRQNPTLSGVTLGVIPDYGFDGRGLRITGTRNGGPADTAGLEEGDIIIELNGEELVDIYAYMDILNKLEEGQSSTVTVKRGGRRLTFDLKF